MPLMKNSKAKSSNKVISQEKYLCFMSFFASAILLQFLFLHLAQDDKKQLIKLKQNACDLAIALQENITSATLCCYSRQTS